MRCDICAGGISAASYTCQTCGAAAGSPAVWPHAVTQPVRGIGVAAAVAVGAATATEVVLRGSPLIWASLARRAAGGGDSDLLTFAVLGAALLSALHWFCYLTAIVLVIVWFHRTRKNLDAFPDAMPSNRAGWAIAGWLVPFVNFVLPYRIMGEIAGASVWRRGLRPLLGLWWAAWLIYLFADRYVSVRDSEAVRALPDSPTDPTGLNRYVSYYQQAFRLNLVPLVAVAVAGAALIVLIRWISNGQQARLGRGVPTTALLPGMTVAVPAWPGTVTAPVPPAAAPTSPVPAPVPPAAVPVPPVAAPVRGLPEALAAAVEPTIGTGGADGTIRA